MGCGNSKTDGRENRSESSVEKSEEGDNTVPEPKQNGEAVLIQSESVEVEDEKTEKEKSREEPVTLQSKGGTGDGMLGISVNNFITYRWRSVVGTL